MSRSRTGERQGPNHPLAIISWWGGAAPLRSACEIRRTAAVAACSSRGSSRPSHRISGSRGPRDRRASSSFDHRQRGSSRTEKRPVAAPGPGFRASNAVLTQLPELETEWSAKWGSLRAARHGRGGRTLRTNRERGRGMRAWGSSHLLSHTVCHTVAVRGCV
jgi:hypothetical protein